MEEWKVEVKREDEEIVRYREMSAEDVRKELRDAGIEPALAVAAVRKLIRDKLAQRVAPR